MHSTLQEDVQTAVSAAVSARRGFRFICLTVSSSKILILSTVNIKYDVPNDRLDMFDQYMKDIDTFYGEYQAGADAESKGPLTSFTFDDVEPGVVAERG